LARPSQFLPAKTDNLEVIMSIRALSNATVVPYAARARWAKVRIETADAVYVGLMYIPETKKRLSDVLCDDRPFIALTEVTREGTDAHEPFVAINKSFVRTVRVLSDGASGSQGAR
jgi:uncharacterized protein DUF6812